MASSIYSRPYIIRKASYILILKTPLDQAFSSTTGKYIYIIYVSKGGQKENYEIITYVKKKGIKLSI